MESDRQLRAVKDLCQPSIDILRARCVEWFQAKGIKGPLYFPDQDELLFGAATSEVVNVVFFGSFLRRFLESANWTPARFRFWVLCDAARDVLVGLMGVPARHVGVIPRYELYPAAVKQREFPRPGEPFTLVYAGRLAPTKNVELLIRTASALQTREGIRAELVLFGRYDDDLHVDRDCPEAAASGEFRSSVQRTIDDCDWVVPPRIVEGLGPEDWTKEKIRNPVLCTLSTFIGEDFGVSIAQAQAMGWPCLLSDWGAHREVTGPGVLKIPLPLIGIYETRELASLRARELARFVRAFIGRSGKAEGVAAPARKLRLPAPVTVQKLDKMRRALVEQLGRCAYLICRGELYRGNGMLVKDVFFAKYRQLFMGSVPKQACVFLVNGPDFPEGPALERIPGLCRELLDQAEASGVEVSFLSVQDINNADTLSILAAARKVIIPFFIEEFLVALAFVRGSLPKEVPLSVYAHIPRGGPDGRLREKLRALKRVLGPKDRLREFDSAGSLTPWVAKEFDECTRSTKERLKRSGASSPAKSSSVTRPTVRASAIASKRSSRPRSGRSTRSSSPAAPTR